METINNNLNYDDNTINYNDYFQIGYCQDWCVPKGSIIILFDCERYNYRDTHIGKLKLAIDRTVFENSKYSKIEYNNLTICNINNKLYLHENCFMDFIKEYNLRNNKINIFVHSNDYSGQCGTMNHKIGPYVLHLLYQIIEYYDNLNSKLYEINKYILYKITINEDTCGQYTDIRAYFMNYNNYNGNNK